MKIAVLVSGGVDSSVALALLKNQGHDVHAFYLKIWLDNELAFLGTCPWQEDLAYVHQICEQLSVPLNIAPLQIEYRNTIVAYTIDQIREGKTPNPDILCNQYIKFGFFLDSIDSSFEKVASGHYANLIPLNGTLALKQSPDSIKDQTYFLCRLNNTQLERCLFPIGHMTKTQVRALAHAFDLPNKDRKDSQGICFLGKFKFNDFIKHHLGERCGNLIEYETGDVVGQHLGFWFYTIGQRHGLRLPAGPWYVVSKDVGNNIVYISKTYYESHHIRKEFTATQCHWFDSTPFSTRELLVRLRHGQHLHNALATRVNNDECHITLKENDQGIAPGQFAAFYDRDICVGSGIIG